MKHLQVQHGMLLSRLLSNLPVFFTGFVYKPYSFKTLWDVLHDKHGAEPQQRISTLGKCLYCRITGSSSMDCSFELFLTDSSLQNTPGPDELLRYVKVVGKSCHVLPPELRQAQTNYPMILSAKHLFLKVQGMLEVGLFCCPSWAFFSNLLYNNIVYFSG